MAVPGSPRSLILTPIDSAYAISYFLLVIDSNLNPILHRFWDTATSGIFPTLFSFNALALGESFRIFNESYIAKTSVLD